MARGPMLHMVKNAKATEGSDQHAMANPTHSTISPKKLAPETNSNIPPGKYANTVRVIIILCNLPMLISWQSVQFMIWHHHHQFTIIISLMSNARMNWMIPPIFCASSWAKLNVGCPSRGNPSLTILTKTRNLLAWNLVHCQHQLAR